MHRTRSTDSVYSYRRCGVVCLFVYLSVSVSAGHVTTVSPAKTDEPTCDQAMSPYATITVATCYTRSQKR